MFGIFKFKSESKTALHEAAANGDNDRVERLLKDVADVNLRDRDERTVLHWAAIKGHPQVVKTLLSHPKIDVKITDKVGKQHCTTRRDTKAKARWKPCYKTREQMSGRAT
jgi:ankyrin repeat protein